MSELEREKAQKIIRKSSEAVFIALLAAVAFFLFLYHQPFIIEDLEWFAGIQVFRIGLLLISLLLVLHWHASGNKRYARYSRVIALLLLLENISTIPIIENHADYSTSNLRVSTINIENSDVVELLDLISNGQVDIAFIQEISPEDSVLLREASSRKSYSLHMMPLRPRGDSVIAILTRLRIIDRDTVEVSSANDTLRWFPKLKMEKDGRIFSAIGVHLESVRSGLPESSYSASWSSRCDQVEILATEVLKTDMPLVIGGDFNATPTDRSIKLLRRMMEDSWQKCGAGLGGTWQRNLAFFRIDKILYRGFETAANPWRFLYLNSDHRGLQVDLIPMGGR